MTVSVLPVEAIAEYPDFVNQAVGVHELTKGWHLEVPTAPCRIEAVLPDGVRLEKELRRSEVAQGRVEVVLGRRKRSQRSTGTGQGDSLRSVASDSLVLGEEYAFEGDSSRRLKSKDTQLAIDFAGTDELAHLGLFDGNVPLTKLGFESEFEDTVYHFDDAPRWSVPLSTTAVTSWLGIDTLGRARPDEQMHREASVRVTSAALIADLELGQHRLRNFASELRARRYGILRESGERYTIPLPIKIGHEESLDIDVRVTVRGRPRSGQLRRIQVEARPRDALLGSMLALVQRGEIASASSVMAAATEMLYGKFTNPYLAALGAHVLFGAEGATGRQSWHHWVENLAEQFPHIPDGKIVLAALMLRKARGLEYHAWRSDIELVRDAKKICLQAIGHGFPQYSASTRLLARIVGIIAGFERNNRYGLDSSDVNSTEKLLNVAQWLSAHVDPRQGLTVSKHVEREQEYA